MMSRNVRTEARLIDDLLDVTRISRRKLRIEPQPLDVHGAVREAIETLSPAAVTKRLSVEVHLDADHHHASADPVRLKQVFWNLLSNSVKFTPERGHIELRSWNNTASGKRWLAVEVSDTGKGFEPAASAGLFEAFEQGPEAPERNGGLGLGLAICKGVMELHGGRIAASSRGPGTGARFVIEIETIADVPASLEGGPAARDAPSPTKPRILLVDDHEDTADTLGELLNDAGYEVRTARSAEAALSTDLAGVDLVVSDIGLPGRSGLDLMRSLRANHHLKGVALSGYGTEADIRASEEAGFSAHLTKPVDFERLLATIREVTASP
jgi:CheY-like chemotaxis protein